LLCDLCLLHRAAVRILSRLISPSLTLSSIVPHLVPTRAAPSSALVMLSPPHRLVPHLVPASHRWPCVHPALPLGSSYPSPPRSRFHVPGLPLSLRSFGEICFSRVPPSHHKCREHIQIQDFDVGNPDFKSYRVVTS
jgi:hypothetical protein